MKPLKFSFLLILVALVFVLSGASNIEKITSPKETEPQSKKAELDIKEPAQKRTPSDVLPSKPPIDKYPPDKQTTEKKNRAWQPTDWFNLFLVIFTACLVGVGIAQAFIYRKQARYMRHGLKITGQVADAAQRSADIADKSLRLLNRPFVDVHFELPFQPVPNQELRIRYTIKNSGKTWAFIKNIESQIWHGDNWKDYLGKTFSIPQGILSTEANLGPSQDLMRHVLIPAMDPDTIATIKNGYRKFMVHGLVVYDDIFGKRHFTRFSRIYRSDAATHAGGFIFPREGEPNENEVDQETDANGHPGLSHLNS